MSLVRFAIGLQGAAGQGEVERGDGGEGGEGGEQSEGAALDGLQLRPFADDVNQRFQTWIFRHNAQRATAFTPEQTDWLRLMKDHIAASCCITRSDFDYAELAGKGGLQKVWALFGGQLDALMGEMNEALVA